VGRYARLSEATVEKIIRVLRLVLDGAMRDQLLARNPVDASERVSAPRKDAHYLPATDVLKILQSASHTRYAAILSLIATTGFRKGEALALLWNDVDLERGTLRVRKTLSRVDGNLVRTDPKTEKSKRTIPLRGTAATVLAEHRKAQLVERVRAANIWTDTGHVFTSELVNRWIREMFFVR
jgi:integrase